MTTSIGAPSWPCAYNAGDEVSAGSEFTRDTVPVDILDAWFASGIAEEVDDVGADETEHSKPRRRRRRGG